MLLMDWLDPHPEVEVQPAAYQRLLGYPPAVVMEGRALELAQWAREWYREHGHPWIYARQAAHVSTDGAAICIEGAHFHTRLLARRFQQAAADGAILLAVGAGPELELEAQRLWSGEKPDEYYFLEVFGSAVVEQLLALAAAHLCAWAEDSHMAVLPHYSPGYPGWNVAEQPRLLELLRGPGNLEALPSGALRPKKSQLAVFPLTRHTEGVRRLTDLAACENCTLAACQYRRK